MTALDIIVLLLVGGCAIFGFMRGFVCETLSLMAWVLGIFAVRLFQEPVAYLVDGWVGTEAGAAVLAFAITFGFTFLAGKFLAQAIGKRTRTSILGPIDRVLGAGFGMLKGLIGATLLFLAFSLVYDTIYGGDAPRPGWLEDSRTYPLLNASGSAISAFVEARRTAGAQEPAADED